MSAAAKKGERKFVREFIEAYRNLPALWKTKSDEYSDRNKKSESYETLLRKYQEKYPEATTDDVKKKINILRTNFMKERRKVCDSEKSGVTAGEVYESSLWYYEDMLFLSGRETPAVSRNSIDVTEENDNGTLVDCREIEVRSSKPRPRTKIRNESEELISLACKRLRGDRDDLDKLALAWASELRRMSPTQQIFAKKAINDVLIEGQLGTLHRHSVSINVVSPPPPAQNDPTAVANALQSPVEWKTDCQ
ncbi:uncharacterized protein LOC135216112 isoform X1 [Macrobrachium nipponense]|uniref:uncharacterized protein LOC135216112 isoform X1 n=1 Tax=Macrobrachium nipponense TaxID=159736 RepID=UPI0030C84F81